jgi:hypothetical protein
LSRFRSGVSGCSEKERLSVGMAVYCGTRVRLATYPKTITALALAAVLFRFRIGS